MSSSVEVVVRLRPLNENEKKHGTLPVISASTNDKTVTVIKGQGSRQARSSFSFDNVFTAFSTQEEVFEATLKPVIRDVLMGYESTVFAYGQTGTGKTHTMEGDLSNPESHGVIPRSAQAIFEALKNPTYQSYTVTCSYLEIYNEDLCDLLTDNSATSKRTTKLEIMEGKTGPFCRGLSEKQVESAENVLELMKKAQQYRKVGETNMNKHSSRSHCIFTMRVETQRRVPDGSILESIGKLHMVDLAGSECAKTANFEKGCQDQAARERERLNINRSLLTLGRVVSMLKEQSTSKKKSSNVRIPYRDSKLTRILQESLGGRCKTCIIATLSPSITAIDESISTLNYAQAANGIVNKPVSSTYMTHSAMPSTPMKIASSEGNGLASVEHWQEMECRLEYMKAQVEEAQAALARKHLLQQELEEKAKKAEQSQLEAENRYAEATTKISFLNKEIEEYVTQKEALKIQLNRTETTLKKTAVVLEATQQTEKNLTSEASTLLHTLKESIADGNKMHQNILENRDCDIERKKATKNFNIGLVSMLEGILSALSSLSEGEEIHRTTIGEQARKGHDGQKEFLEHSLKTIGEVSENVAKTVSALKSLIADDNGILSIHESASSKMLDGVQKTEAIASDYEKELFDSLKSVQDHLTASAAHLNGLDSAYSKSANDLLVALKASVFDSKEKMSDMVTSAAASLESARCNSAQAREALRLALGAWKGSVLESASTVEQSSNTQNGVIKDTLNMMTSEMSRHDDMEAQLIAQRTCVLENRSSHLGNLREQRELLSSQKESFTAAYERQKILSDEFVTNIMKGVQEMVNTHMALVTEEADNSFAKFISNNDALVKTNGTASDSAQEFLDAVEETNISLKENVGVVRRNETQVANVLKDTTSVLNEISTVSKDQKRSTEDSFSKSESCLHDLAIVDSEVQTIGETLQNDSDRYGTHLMENVLEQNTESIEQLSSSCKDAFAYVRDTAIAKTSSAITSMEGPHRDAVSRLTDECGNLRGLVADETREIQRVSTEQSKLAETLRNRIGSMETEFVGGTAKRHLSEIHKHHEKLLQTVETHEVTALAKLAESKNQAGAAKESVGDFVTNVIEVEKEVAAAPERVVPVYSDHLSSTPSESILLQRMQIVRVPSPVENGSMDENGEQRSINSDESEVGSKDLSPVLQERPLSSDNSAPQEKKTKTGQKSTLKRPNSRGRKDSKPKRKKFHSLLVLPRRHDCTCCGDEAACSVVRPRKIRVIVLQGSNDV